MTTRVEPPKTTDELLARARRLAGRTLGSVAAIHGLELPTEPRRGKGWAGRLAEIALGAPGGGASGPDFLDLGVELKTLPIDHRGVPRESTGVCIAPVDGDLASTWEASRVRAKLACVLWVPVVVDRDIPLADRRFGAPGLWVPDAAEESDLRSDWEELSELLRLGQLDASTAHLGRCLQLRPKAANARETVWVVGEDGTWVRAQPRGFYLRATFTARVARRLWVLPGGG